MKICSSSSEKEFHEIRLSNHLNPLFKQMLFETKNQIDEYFLTISPTNKLKGVDLYQLLSEILSNYYLYEYNCDSKAFFDKVNSFNSFLEVVTKF